MSFEEEFDKIIRQKAEEAKYSFDEASWHKVNGLLDAERKAAGAVWYKNGLLPVGALLIIGVAAYLTYSIYASPAAGTSLANSAQKSLDLTEQVASEKTPVVDQTPGKEDPTAVSSANTNNIGSDPIPQSLSNTASKPASTASKATQALPAPQQETDLNAETSTPISAQNVLAAIQQPVQQTQTSTSGAPEQKDHPNATDTELPEVPNENARVNDNNQQPSEAKEIAAENLIAGKITENETQQLASEALNPIWALLPVSEKDNQLKETFAYPVIKDEDYYNKGKLNRKHYLTAEAGAMYLFGWDREAVKDGKGLDFYGGLNYGRYLHRNLSISVGLQVYNIANINNPYYAVSRKEYGFGSTTIYTVVTTNNLVFASVPVRIHYALNHFNTLGLGVNVGYLVSATSVVESYYLRDNEKMNLTQPQHSNRIYEGTQSMNLMLTAAYSVQLTNRFGLKAEYVMGLTDLFKNSGTISSVEKTSGLRVGIQYTLFDK